MPPPSRTSRPALPRRKRHWTADTITVIRGDETDHDAVIGFDPPLRTFFLQAFMGGGFREIWLGTLLEEFTSLEAITEQARAQGYEIADMPKGTIIEMTKLAAQRHPPSIGERLGIVR